VRAEATRRTALDFLGIAIAVSVVIAFPVEEVTHRSFALDSYWSANACDRAEALLVLGVVVLAILTPILVFLLPGPGSILGRSGARSTFRRVAKKTEGGTSTLVVALALLIVCPLLLLRGILVLENLHLDSITLLSAAAVFEMAVQAITGALGTVAGIYLLRRHVAMQPALFFVGGWLLAAGIAGAWWIWIRHHAGLGAACPVLFDLGRAGDQFHVDFVSDCRRYYVCGSVFAAFWVGIVAGGMRLQAARASEGDSKVSEGRLFRNFFWVYVLGWAVQYRVSQWLSAPKNGNLEQEWIAYSVLSFVYLTASTVWSLAFIRLFWNLKARTLLANVMVAFAGTIAICMLNVLTFFWMFLWAPLAAVPLFKGNVTGVAWALVVGTWRWRSLQRLPAAAAAVTLAPANPAPSDTAANQPAPREAATSLPTITNAATTSAAGAQAQAPAERPNFASLRAIEIVGAGIAAFMLLAIVWAMYMWFFVVYHGPRR
jgi:hypothetical protein